MKTYVFLSSMVRQFLTRRSTSLPRRSGVILVLLVAYLGGLSCSSSSAEGEPSSSSEASQAPEQGLIAISKQQWTNSDLGTASLKMDTFSQEIHVSGVVGLRPNDQAGVSPYFPGYIRDIPVLPGDHVKKGQRLFTLENPRYLEIQRDYRELHSQIDYLREAYHRQRRLLEDSVTSRQKYLRARSDYRSADARLEALEGKLAMMGLDTGQVKEKLRSQIQVRSPLEGYVAEVHVRQGEFLPAQQVAVGVISQDHLHLELDVFEQEMAGIREGQRVDYRLADEASQSYPGEIFLVAPSVNAQKRTARVHVHPDMEQAPPLLPGQYVQATLQLNARETYSLPMAAVVEQEGKFYALQELEPRKEQRRFRKVEVKPGLRREDRVEVLNGEALSRRNSYLSSGTHSLMP